ncbi:UNVERIFIED_CONTAM: hypothetical protein Sindi_3034500, partial [Sesamum indicum]
VCCEFAKPQLHMQKMESDRPMQTWNECHTRQSLEPEDLVDPCYSVAAFIEVYKYAILPINDPKLCEETGFISPLPPNFGKGAGRPARAKRLESNELSNKGKKNDKRPRESDYQI